MTKKLATPPARLVNVFELYDITHLNDCWAVLAANVEDSLLQSGAIPGKDYTILDLYKLTQPMVQTCFSRSKNPLEFSVEWNTDEMRTSTS